MPHKSGIFSHHKQLHFHKNGYHGRKEINSHHKQIHFHEILVANYLVHATIFGQYITLLIYMIFTFSVQLVYLKVDFFFFFFFSGRTNIDHSQLIKLRIPTKSSKLRIYRQYGRKFILFNLFLKSQKTKPRMDVEQHSIYARHLV